MTEENKMTEEKKDFKLSQKKTPTFLLPNALTILGVCLGLSSIKFALDLNYEMAVITIGLAAVLDTLDGRVARLVNATSKVGKELDSLTDVISFGVAPSIIIYFWAVNEVGKIGWLLVLVYTVCCALRLARFNLTTIDESRPWKINFFEGVPSPAAAGLVLLPLIASLSDVVQILNLSEILQILHLDSLLQVHNNKIIGSIILITTSILMVSKVPTYSLKRISIPRSLGGFLLLGIGVYISVLIFFTFEVLFFSGLLYIILIPISFFHHKHLNKKFINEDSSEDEIEDIL